MKKLSARALAFGEPIRRAVAAARDALSPQLKGVALCWNEFQDSEPSEFAGAVFKRSIREGEFGALQSGVLVVYPRLKLPRKFSKRAFAVVRDKRGKILLKDAAKGK